MITNCHILPQLLTQHSSRYFRTFRKKDDYKGVPGHAAYDGRRIPSCSTFLSGRGFQERDGRRRGSRGHQKRALQGDKSDNFWETKNLQKIRTFPCSMASSHQASTLTKNIICKVKWVNRFVCCSDNYHVFPLKGSKLDQEGCAKRFSGDSRRSLECLSIL